MPDNKRIAEIDRQLEVWKENRKTVTSARAKTRATKTIQKLEREKKSLESRTTVKHLSDGTPVRVTIVDTRKNKRTPGKGK